MSASESKAPIIVWMRSDLRILDNLALSAASSTGKPVVVVYVYSPSDEWRWSFGAASRWWLHHSLSAFSQALNDLGVQLVVRSGPASITLPKLAEEIGAGSIYFNKRFEPAARVTELEVEEASSSAGLETRSFNSTLLAEPSEFLNGQGTPYLVFTPFWNALRKRKIRPLCPTVTELRAGPSVRSLSIKELDLLPKIKWDDGLRAEWIPGEKSALAQLQRFFRESLSVYPKGRDRPDWDAVSRMSPHLHFGEISSCAIWHAAMRTCAADGQLAESGEAYVRELAWREYANYLLFHFPSTAEQPLRKQFTDFPWSMDRELLQQWQSGQTGYPLVDAGMRQLWRTGWMHNRVRMIVASFLVKDLLIPWQAGAEWFWDTLVDADLANNTMGWQWTAGCGADAAPYFRIFNPVLQGEKFDPKGDYVRQWVPELGKLPLKWLQKPWLAPPDVLKNAGIVLGETYPWPIVDHSEARRRALAAYQTLRA